MRVTNSMMLQSTVRDLGTSLARLQRSQTELTTGRAIQRPSDDPSGAALAMDLRNELRRSDQRARSLDDARGWLATADGALTAGLDLLTRVKSIVVQASNTGAGAASSSAALAAEVRSVRDEMVGLANAEYIDRSIFAGTQVGPAFDASGAFLGNAGAVRREVAPSVTIDVNVTAEAVFGDPSGPDGDLFAVLDRLATAISSGDPNAIAAEHATFDVARERMTAATGTVGARASRVDAIEAANERHRFGVQDSLSQIEDVDLAAALLDVRTRESAYTAALQAAARVLPPSLVDYLR
ncbi:MAG: hypothetical protein QNJ12_01505 [Ilumatobacter sp.]|uniref:flagellin N-terminal helical domain-containing protein n=1 Tax=Ilumatobacter sp. TaxID=1967498 RepID=UPI002616205B|nr:hypothetical protein [Ilumatobacter sp.]MDJ0767430.1 hypothetical protein [Ilumatobacter sp.]